MKRERERNENVFSPLLILSFPSSTVPFLGTRYILYGQIYTSSHTLTTLFNPDTMLTMEFGDSKKVELRIVKGSRIFFYFSSLFISSPLFMKVTVKSSKAFILSHHVPNIELAV